ncbi:hypothetical protein PRZ48_003412 [Zasmidium cellare]|uniref:Uncharacterized protein n=1 Tax=Zasmidium cellare TaxID=395010 RepID=A0ABR0EV03_ZASCE|nr:hypothetical protein PRZ48_003412 [Zasmidium cellare]
MATTQIDMVFGWTSHPQKDQIIKEVRDWLVKTDPIPGSLPAGQKPGRVEIWSSPVPDDNRVLVKYEGAPPGHYGGYFLPISFVPSRQ